MKKATWFVLFLFLAVSCLDDPDCFLLNNDVIGISFRVMGSDNADSVSIESLTINNISYTSDDSVFSFLPIRADRFTTFSNIEIKNKGISRKLDLSYLVKVQFVSEDCGARYILSDLDTLGHDFDSVALVNRTPGREASSVNIQVFRCPQPDTLGLTLFQLTLPRTGRAGSRAISAEFNSVSSDGIQPLYTNKRSTTLHLPVNLNSSDINYSFDFKSDFGYDEQIRNLALGYNVRTEKRYGVCGIQQFVDSLRFLPVNENAFDSVSFVNDRRGNPKTRLTDPIETNFNIYRCPPTNIVQIAFVNEGTTTSNAIDVKSITTDYTTEIFYEDAERVTRVQLPLDPNATATVFTLNYGEVSETITLNYSWTDPRITLFKPGRACSNRKVITDLSEGGDNNNVAIADSLVLFPAVTNLYIEVAD